MPIQSMKTPCPDCPFLVGSTFDESMCRARAREIADSLSGGGMFPCHKTTTNGGAKSGREQWCVGALATMENQGGAHYNQMVRISERLGMLDLDQIEGLDLVHASLDEWVELHP